MKVSKIVYRICLFLVFFSFFMPICCDQNGPECVEYAFDYGDSELVFAAVGLIVIAGLGLLGVFLFREKESADTDTRINFIIPAIALVIALCVIIYLVSDPWLGIDDIDYGAWLMMIGSIGALISAYYEEKNFSEVQEKNGNDDGVSHISDTSPIEEKEMSNNDINNMQNVIENSVNQQKESFYIKEVAFEEQEGTVAGTFTSLTFTIPANVKMMSNVLFGDRINDINNLVITKNGSQVFIAEGNSVTGRQMLSSLQMIPVSEGDIIVANIGTKSGHSRLSDMKVNYFYDLGIKRNSSEFEGKDINRPVFLKNYALYSNSERGVVRGCVESRSRKTVQGVDLCLSFNVNGEKKSIIYTLNLNELSEGNSFDFEIADERLASSDCLEIYVDKVSFDDTSVKIGKKPSFYVKPKESDNLSFSYKFLMEYTKTNKVYCYFKEEEWGCYCPYCGEPLSKDDVNCPKCNREKVTFPILEKDILDSKYEEWVDKKNKEKIEQEARLKREREEEEARRKKEEEEEKRRVKRTRITIVVILTVLALAYGILELTYLGPKRRYDKAVETFNTYSDAEKIAAYPEMVKIGYPLPELSFSDRGKIVEKTSVLPSTKVDYPILPDINGVHFLGWHNGNSKAVEKEGEMPLYSSMLYSAYGNYFKYYDADGSEISVALVYGNDVITKTEEALLSSLTDCEVYKWKDQNGNLYSPNDTIENPKSDLELTAVYKIPLVVYMPDGSTYKNETVGYSDVVSIPSFDEENGYIGWSYKDDMDTIHKETSISVVRKTDIVLRSKYKATFTNDLVPSASFVQEFFLDKGVKISQNSLVKKTDYFNVGWCDDEKIYTNYITTVNPTENVEYKAVYIPREYAGKGESYFTFFVNTKSGIIEKLPTSPSEISNIIEYNVPQEWFDINSSGNIYIKDSYSSNKSSIQYLAIPKSFKGKVVQCVADNTFKNCTQLKYISLPSSVERIGYSAFENCNNLKMNLTLSSSITFIGNYAFRNSGIVFDSVDVTGCSGNNSVGYNAFTGTTVKKLVVGSNGVRSVDNSGSTSYPFYNVKGFTTLQIKSGTSTLYNVLSDSMRKTITEVLGFGIPTSISSNAFASCTNLKVNLVIGSKVTSIGSNAFKDSGITFDSVDVTGCSGNNSVGYNAFTGTTVKKLVVGSSGVRSVDNSGSSSYPFYGVKGFETLSLKGTEFYNVMSSSMKSSVKEIEGFENIVEVGSSALENCYSLKKTLVITSKVKAIGSYAFRNSSGITFDSVDVTGCSGNNSVGYNAFTGTTVKKLVVGSNGVRSVDNSGSTSYPFYNVKGFTTLQIKSGTSTLYNVLSDSMRKTITEVTVPSSVKEIVSNTFSGCSLIKEIKLPKGIKINSKNFENLNTKIVYY